MSITEALKGAGFTKEKSRVGDKPIMVGVYKATFTDFAQMEDKGYGASIYAQFKVSETLVGRDSTSQYPEFKGYFNTSPEKVASKRNGLAKLINGLFSVGVDVPTDSDEALLAGLEAAKGAEVYIKGYEKKPIHQVDGQWVDNPEGDVKQGFSFMTLKNAEKEIEKAKKAGKAPF